LLDPDEAFQQLATDQLLAIVAGASDSVLSRGRALLELGRRAGDNPELTLQVASLIRDPVNRRSFTVGAISVAQLGAAGLIAGGGESEAALARELVGEWTAGEQADFAWLMNSQS
jgi:hypothetical protein